MHAIVQPRPDHSEPASPAGAGSIASGGSVTLADADRDAPDAPPPHRLWATLETAYAPPEEAHSTASDEPWAFHLALPMAVALSLALWVIIVEVVLRR